MSISNNARLFVVIVNFKSQEIYKSLSSLRRHLSDSLQVVIIDNGGLDYRRLVKHSDIKVIRNRANLGFAIANNLAIEYAVSKKATHVILINPDTNIGIEDIYSLLACSGDVVGPTLSYIKEGATVYDRGGRVNWLLGRPYHLESYSGHSTFDGQIDFVSGAVMLVRRGVFEKVGLFDEKYFLYFEDVDFCTRCIRHGFTVKVCSDVIVNHKLGESVGRDTSLKHFHNLRSNFIFITKNVKVLAKPFAYIYWVLLVLLVSSKFTLARFHIK